VDFFVEPPATNGTLFPVGVPVDGVVDGDPDEQAASTAPRHRPAPSPVTTLLKRPIALSPARMVPSY